MQQFEVRQLAGSVDKTIVIKNLDDFDINHILLCGQIFRYKQTGENRYEIFSKDKKCIAEKLDGNVVLTTQDTDYFIHFFDLERDYSEIKNALKGLPLMDDAIKNGNGIRILKQDKWEMLISFIISANNHIPRIKSIIERLCETLGDKKDGYFAFPTPAQMAEKDASFYKSIGAGYRDKYLDKTSKMVAAGFDLDKIDSLSSIEASKELSKFMGVGAKVADCILLFAYHRQDVFPVDTWIRKVYADVIEFESTQKVENTAEYECKFIDDSELKKENTAEYECKFINDSTIIKENLTKDKNEISGKIIREKLIAIYGKNSGYAQQYLFFNKRGE